MTDHHPTSIPHSLEQEACEKLRGILMRMGVAGEVVAHEDAERIVLEVCGGETGLVIGRQGATLDALQYLVNRMIAHHREEVLRKPIVLDAEGYRERRVEALEELAHRLADKARKSGRPVAAQPMNAADRRVIHMALADVADVRTYSEGEGIERHVVVSTQRDGDDEASAGHADR